MGSSKKNSSLKTILKLKINNYDTLNILRSFIIKVLKLNFKVLN